MRKFILIAISLYLISSCHKSTKCDESELYTYLTPNQKSIVPYLGNETLKYKSTDGEILTFKCVGGKQSFIKTQKVGEDINCGRPWYLENLNYTFLCIEDSIQSFQVSNRVNTEYSFSTLDLFIKNAPSIKSEDYHLTTINFFKDSLLINGKNFKALNLYFNSGGLAGKWVQEYGFAQILIGTKYFTIMH
ncbi:MAG: hypothetical protein RLZZ381_3114 [Cyanobacteriota bacterium]|jgi:hypothetical protein